jgi:hypothetical protein
MVGPREGTSAKALALLIAALIVWTIYVTAAAPLFSYYERTAQSLQDRQELAHRYQNLARDLPRLRAAAAQRLSQSHDAGLLLIGPTDAVAAAMMQSALKELIEGQGAKLTSAEMLPGGTEAEIVRQIGVRIAFSGNLKLLTSVIEGIETTRPLLSIGNLDVHGAGASQAEAADGVLAVAMDVYGFLPQ